jgi:hypothetical protein
MVSESMGNLQKGWRRYACGENHLDKYKVVKEIRYRVVEAAY